MASSLREPTYEPYKKGLPFSANWTETLFLERQGQKRMEEAMKEIEAKCKASHERKHVAECDDCFGLIVDEMRSRFFGSPDNKEWFSRRQTFLTNLEKTLARAKERKDTLRPAWELVKGERDDWFRDELQRYECFYQVALNPATGDKFEALLQEAYPDCDELLEVVKQGMISPKLGGSNAERLAVLQELFKIHQDAKDPNEIRDRVVGLLIEGPDRSYDATWLRGPEMESFEFLDLSGLAEMVGKHHKIGSSRSARERLAKEAQRRRDRERLLKQIDTLQRAQAAHKRQQVETTKKKKKRQFAKAMSEVLCGKCRKHRDKWECRDILSCMICQVNVVVWGHQKLEAWCSDDCMDKGLQYHVDEKHVCDSGSECRLLRKTPSDSNWYLEEDQLLCLECIKTPTASPTIFCSKICAEATMVKHFERLHPQERKRLASEEGKIVPDVGKYLVHVEDLHRERVVPILDDKDLVLVEASKSQARGSACGGDQ